MIHILLSLLELGSQTGLGLFSRLLDVFLHFSSLFLSLFDFLSSSIFSLSSLFLDFLFLKIDDYKAKEVWYLLLSSSDSGLHVVSYILGSILS